MRKLFFASAVALSLYAVPAGAQQSIVAQAKEDLRAHGYQVENRACTDFEIAKIVAGRIPGAGLLTKDCCGDAADPNRSHCEFNGVWYAHDVVAFADGTLVDIAVDGGGANGPNYEVSPADPSLITRYRSAVSLGLNGVVPGSSPAPVPVPVPVPQPQPAPVPPAGQDYTGLLEQILSTQNALLLTQNELLALSKDTNAHVVSIDHTFTQTLGHFSAFVGKYIAPAIGGFIAAHQLGK
jgi:hypothetical protein